MHHDWSKERTSKWICSFSSVDAMTLREKVDICIMKRFSMVIVIIFSMVMINCCHGQNVSGSKKRLGIVGGNDVGIEDFPYQGGLLYKDVLKCGCSAISKNCFLSAGEL